MVVGARMQWVQKTRKLKLTQAHLKSSVVSCTCFTMPILIIHLKRGMAMKTI